DDVEALARANAREAAKRLPRHRLVAERRREIGSGLPALDVAAEWRGEEGPVYTRQVHVAVGGAWLVFAASGPTPAARAACDDAIERAVSTFRVRD
ncbi:MAG TPA: DcrB-related protein, partial [Minicystis sp.]|nr:DcrB-related protein [Minicystis sp.]